MKLREWALALALGLVLSTPVYAQTGTIQTKDELNTKIDTKFPDNNQGLITPSILREISKDIVVSYTNTARINAQTGTVYNVVASDYGKLLTLNNASPVAVTLPQATGSFAVFTVHMCNYGAGVVTVTPNISTISGQPNIQLVQTQCRSIISDGANWQMYGGGTTGGSGVVAITCPSSQQIYTINSSGVASCRQSTFADISGTAGVAQGGTGITSGTIGGIPYFQNTTAIASSGALTQFGVVLGGGTSNPPSSTAVGTSGQLLVGSGAAPQWQTLSGDSIINSAGAMTNTKVNGISYPAGPQTPNFVPVVQADGVSVLYAAQSGGGGGGSGGGGPLAVKVFTTVGAATYTPSAGMASAVVECVGGGGAGAAALGDATAYAVGGGGGSGGYSRKLVTAAQVGASQTVTIGAGGTGGASNGPAGTATSFGTLCVANGGGGGGIGNSGTQPKPGLGASIAGAVGDVTSAGAPGGPGQLDASRSALAYNIGIGGSSVFGGGGANTATPQAGQPASNYGSGGAGGSSTTGSGTGNGGNGSAGIVIVTEYGPASNTGIATTSFIQPPLTTGSGTYTPGGNVISFTVELVGAGGGGAGGGSGSPGAGGNGTNTTFGSLTAGGGQGGPASGATPPTGGTATGGDLNTVGSIGGREGATGITAGSSAGGAGAGGASYFGGAGRGNYGGTVAGANAQSNTGSGGAGGSSLAAAGAQATWGGAAGGYVRKVYSAPFAIGGYAWAVGTKGAAGSAGTSGVSGGTGADGVIIITEFIATGVTTATSIKRTVFDRTAFPSGTATYTPSAGLMAADVECVGGGGAGAGVASSANATSGGGGGSGGYSRRALTAAQIGASQSVTIGVGGTPGAAGNNPGGAGGDTFIGASLGAALCAARGGLGGVPFNGNQGNGNIAGAVGDIIAAGAPGIPGVRGGTDGNAVPVGSPGGSSFFGGAAAATSLSTAGQAASNYGSGGSGGSSTISGPTVAGGAGSGGVVIVTEYIAAVAGTTSTVAPGGLVLIQRQDVSSAVAQVDFTTGIDATYDEYEFHIFDLKGTADASLYLRVSTDGGSTFISSGSYNMGFRISGSQGTNIDGQQVGSAQLQVGTTQTGTGTVSAPGWAGTIKFAVPYNTGRSKLFMFDYSGHNATFSYYRIVGAGGNTTTAAVNAIRFLMSTGNIAQGTFILYGVKK